MAEGDGSADEPGDGEGSVAAPSTPPPRAGPMKNSASYAAPTMSAATRARAKARDAIAPARLRVGRGVRIVPAPGDGGRGPVTGPTAGATDVRIRSGVLTGAAREATGPLPPAAPEAAEAGAISGAARVAAGSDPGGGAA